MSKKGQDFLRNYTQPRQENKDQIVAGSFSLTSPENKRSNPTMLLSSNSGNVSSEEDNSSDSGDMSCFSLAAFAVKNRISKNNLKDSFGIAGTGADLKDPIPVENRMEESNSDFSDSEGFSLHKLASKYKSSKMSGSSLNATDHLSTDNSISKELQSSKSEKDFNPFGENIITNISGSDEIDSSNKYTYKSSDKITSNFLAVQFSDDSDSDECMSLAGLVSNHKSSIIQGETGSADDLRSLKPRALTRVTSTQRYHTKSESDSLSPVSQSKKGLENETSTSLSSLKSGVETGKDFKFSLGCNIPNSFKSKHIGSLTSSLRSLGMVSPESKHSHSDTDVHVVSRVKKPLSVGTPSTDVTDIEFGGINLSCAIKIPSITKSSDIETSQMDTDMSNEPEEMELMTLLDQLDVEDENEELVKKMEEDCTFDATYMLKVKMKLQTKKCSTFGKVICRKWKPLYAPYFKKEIFQSTVVPFTFSTLSPDDEVASYLKKRH